MIMGIVLVGVQVINFIDRFYVSRALIWPMYA